MSIIMSIFVFSCLIQEVSNIKVVQNSMKISHETFWIALVAINVLLKTTAIGDVSSFQNRCSDIIFFIPNLSFVLHTNCGLFCENFY